MELILALIATTSFFVLGKSQGKKRYSEERETASKNKITYKITRLSRCAQIYPS
ncbi:hypothetical protein [Chryseobacterium sp. CFS15]|uniref:hypothetical protein n=1 Tax=Chryseobacterium sp. CFS15 TaxID=2986946 RepID=UPI00280872F4|nr:hypothetical protein [Chryseobacterium sp. CFS15]MDQ8141648.1 hypothetical protein [Chryseobacterium sp. CFS15]